MQTGTRILSIVLWLLPMALALGQNTNGPAKLSKAGNNLVATWPGIGTLQSAPATTGPWQDILEATSPRTIAPTNTRSFLRVISRWNKRANLLAANSEMGVAELNG